MPKRNNDFFKNKKEWSITKDDILSKYLTPYFQKIFALRKPVCYIDCFAGKGIFEDGSVGSPIIAIEKVDAAISQSSFKPSVSTYFIELNYAEELNCNIEKHNKNEIKYQVINGKFEDNIDFILAKHPNDTVFLYIDPYGIKAIDVDKFNSFKLHKNKSVELLINYNTWGFFREACRVLKAEFKMDDEINEYLVEYDPSNDVNREELSIIAGGDYWIDIVMDYKNNRIDAKEAENRISNGIANAFRKSYKYVLNVPIKSSLDNAIPKYRLFHLTNHNKGCLIMADNMYKRFNEACERQKDGQLSLFNYSASGELDSPETIRQRLVSVVDYCEKRITDVMCDYYCQYGISSDRKTLRNALKMLEEDGTITIRREPLHTKTGKISFAMDESNGQRVYVKKGIKMKTTERKSLLYKTGVEYGDYTINHVFGCHHGCLFPCYAYQMAKRFGNVHSYEEWIEPKLVSNALEILDKEIPIYKKDIKFVHLCFTTDPFMMGYPEVTEMSLNIIKKLNSHNIKVSTLTKGIVPFELSELSPNNEIGISLLSLNDDFRKKYEPNSSNYMDRINSLKAIHDAGVKTWVSIEPFPTPNIVEEDIDKLLESISFVDKIVFGRWHYNKLVSEYKNYQSFYNEVVEKVVLFCKQNNIHCHIKSGTYIVNSEKKEIDF